MYNEIKKSVRQSVHHNYAKTAKTTLINTEAQSDKYQTHTAIHSI